MIDAAVEPFVIVNPKAGSVSDLDAVLNQLARLTPGRIAISRSPSDGRLDVILIPRLPPADLVIVVAEMLLGTHVSNRDIVHRCATKITIRANPRMRFNVDGEPFGMVPLSFQLTESRLKFVTGRA